MYYEKQLYKAKNAMIQSPPLRNCGRFGWRCLKSILWYKSHSVEFGTRSVLLNIL